GFAPVEPNGEDVGLAEGVDILAAKTAEALGRGRKDPRVSVEPSAARIPMFAVASGVAMFQIANEPTQFRLANFAYRHGPLRDAGTHHVVPLLPCQYWAGAILPSL